MSPIDRLVQVESINRLAALECRLTTAEAILRALEWSGRQSIPAVGCEVAICPVCRKWKVYGHTPDCPFRQLPEG